MCVVGIIFAVGARLLALRHVIVTRGGWLLAPLLGRARPMPRLQKVFSSGDDIVAVRGNGKLITLGVDRFPYRDPTAVRASLLRSLPRGQLPATRLPCAASSLQS